MIDPNIFNAAAAVNARQAANAANAMRRELEKLGAERSKAEAERKQTEERKRKAEEEERRRRAKLADDKNIVFQISLEIDRLSGDADPFSALQSLQSHRKTLAQRRISAAAFESFEDKSFVQKLTDKMATIEKSLGREVVLEIAEQLDRLSGDADPFSALQSLQSQLEATREPGITYAAFESFEDKSFVQKLTDKMVSLEKKLQDDCSKLRAERKRMLVREASQKVDAIAAQGLSVATLLELEAHRKSFAAQKDMQPTCFELVDDKTLLENCLVKMVSERDRVLSALSQQETISLSSLKNWLRLCAIIESLETTGRVIQAAAEGHPYPEEVSLKQDSVHRASLKLARPMNTLFSTVEGILPIAAILCLLVSGIVLSFLSLMAGLIPISVAVALAAVQRTRWKEVFSEHKKALRADENRRMREADARKKLYRERARVHKNRQKRLDAANIGYEKAKQRIQKLQGIDRETLDSVLQLDFPSQEASEFKQSAEAYCRQLQEKLNIHDSLLGVLLELELAA